MGVSEVERVRITVKAASKGRVTGWLVRCSACRRLNLLCRSKITASSLAQAHSRDEHAQMALIAMAIK